MTAATPPPTPQVAAAAATVNVTVNQQLEQLPETERREDWVPLMTNFPMQEHQFCKVMTRFTREYREAERHRNEVKQNMVIRQMREDLANLVPNGKFQNWIVHTVEVKQASDGSAAIILQPSCAVLLGSNYCGSDPTSFEGTIEEDSPLYREIAKLDHRDFVMVSGELLAVKEPERGQPLISYRYFPAGSHCSKVEAAKNQDFFVVQLDSMFKMVVEGQSR